MLNLDWLSFTFRCDWIPGEGIVYNGVQLLQEDVKQFAREEGSELQAFFMVFPEIWEMTQKKGFMYSDRGRRYYDRMLYASDYMFIYYDEKLGNKGVNVEIPSHGLFMLKEFISYPDNCKDYLAYTASYLWDRGCRFSRIDINKDIDKEKCTFGPAELWKLYFNNQIVSHSRCGDFCDVGEVTEYKDGRYITTDRGKTFYLGSLTHRRKMLRVYDKDAESGGEIKAIRYEFEYHNKYAQTLQKEIIDKTFADGLCCISFRDLVEEFCYVVDDSEAKQKCRRKRLKEWELFTELEFCEEMVSLDVKVDLSEKKDSPKTEERIKYWRKCLPSFITDVYCGHEDLLDDILNYCGRYDTWYYKCIDDGREDLISRMSDYRYKNNLERR